MAAEGESAKRKLTLSEILKVGAARYIDPYGKKSAPQVLSTLAKLSLCRTAALGGRKLRCMGCDHQVMVYNSCGDRHCPQCSGAKRSDWMESTEQLLLDGVTYYQVVFTLPKELSRLALGNREVIHNLLFRSAWQAIQETVADEQNYEPAAALVLHTWNQRLEAHSHVHAVVPGGGPALDGSGWTESRRPGQTQSTCDYLVHADSLRSGNRPIWYPHKPFARQTPCKTLHPARPSG